MTVNTSSRFQVVPVAVKEPGVSMLTRSLIGPFLDSGIEVRRDALLGPTFVGHIYFTLDEVREMAEQFGLFEPHERDLELAIASKAIAFDEGYDQGYTKGRAEAVDAAAVGLVDRIRAAVARPGGGGTPAAEDAGGVQPGAVEPVDEPAEERAADGEGAGAGDEPDRVEGRARVPGGAGSVPADTL